MLNTGREDRCAVVCETCRLVIILDRFDKVWKRRIILALHIISNWIDLSLANKCSFAVNPALPGKYIPNYIHVQLNSSSARWGTSSFDECIRSLRKFVFKPDRLLTLAKQRRRKKAFPVSMCLCSLGERTPVVARQCQCPFLRHDGWIDE